MIVVFFCDSFTEIRIGRPVLGSQSEQSVNLSVVPTEHGLILCWFDSPDAVQMVFGFSFMWKESDRDQKKLDQLRNGLFQSCPHAIASHGVQQFQPAVRQQTVCLKQ